MREGIASFSSASILPARHCPPAVEVAQGLGNVRRVRGVVGDVGIVGIDEAFDGDGAPLFRSNGIAALVPFLAVGVPVFLQRLHAVVDGVGIRFRREAGIERRVDTLAQIIGG